MRPSIALQTHKNKIRSIISRHHTKNARIFGSVLHGNDIDGSDLDLLVDPTAETSLLDIAAIRYELKKLLGVDVDVLTPNALPGSFREEVLREAEQI